MKKRVLSLVFVLMLLSVFAFSVGCSNDDNPDKDWTPSYSITDDIKTEYLF